MINNQSYIGLTINLNKRRSQHIRNSFNASEKSYDLAFHRAIRKHGPENFQWNILIDKIPEESLRQYESWYIYLYKTYINGYNSTPGGDFNPMSCPKIRQKLKGRKHSNETKEKIRQSKLGDKNPMFGRKRSEQHNKRLSASLKGKKHSDETKEKIRQSKLGDKNPMFGKKLTEKQKQILSDANRNRVIPESEKERRSNSACKYSYTITTPDNDIIITNNLKKFCRDNNLNHGTMYMVVNGKRKHHKGYKCIRNSNSQDNQT